MSLPLINDFIVDSVYIPISERNSQTRRIRELDHGSQMPKEWIAYVKESNYQLYFFDLSKGIYLDSIDLSSFRNAFIDFFPVSKDSVLIALTDNSIISIGEHGQKQWDIAPLVQKISKYAFIGYLSAYSLDVFGDTVMCITSTAERKVDIGPNIPFLKSNYDILLRLLPDTVECITMRNPNPPYFRIQDFYSNAERVYLNNTEAVFSFNHSDTLTLHNFKTEIDKFVKLQTKNFLPNSPFDYNKVMDYTYITQYSMENYRLGIGSLLYSRGQDQVYQLVQHKGQYIEDDGKKNDYGDLARSLVVLDGRLNQLIEIYIPPQTMASKFFAFTTYKGLYLPAHSSKQKYHDKMLFYRIGNL